MVGLDGEMSGSELADGCRLIQAGLAVQTATGTDVFCELISWPEMLWQDRAASVHGLSREAVDAARPAEEVDEAAFRWLLAHGAKDGERSVISVGFNVGAFDHPFFRHALPRTMSLVSRRTVDLNAVCFTLDGWDPHWQNEPRDWAGWKRSMKAAAVKRLATDGIVGDEHDAGFDAALALHSWLWFKEELQDCHRPERTSPRPGQDPVLARVFGSGLLARLDGLCESELYELANACQAASVQASHWLGQCREEFGGRSGLASIIDGDLQKVLALLRG